ncbi:DinB family protein [Curtobacterium ammoniigenes]|uniref:DinB family protein n=1 Tax=Curtobacterium ammoniigenes TaxID=395387 RepID=UPI000831A548|nr:DinB family protein [Curtobacterium ammoniigenes]
MSIEPDRKDWTWVIDGRCAQCGYDGREVGFRAVPGLILANASAWPTEMERPDVRARPDDRTWSPLEYAAHVRDVYRIFGDRLALMLHEDGPSFPNWDQDATAIEARYGEQDPGEVVRDLGEAAHTLAAAFDDVPDNALGRVGFRSDGAAFTVETLARYMLHDPIHHLWDVRATR